MVLVYDETCEPPMKKSRKSQSGSAVHNRKCSENPNPSRASIFKECLGKYNIVLDDRPIPYEKVDILFKDLNSFCLKEAKISEAELFSEKDAISVLGHLSIRRYFKHNLETYCSFIGLAMKNSSDLDSLLAFLHNENVFSKTLISEREFHKWFFNINLPIFIELLQKYEDAKLFREVCDVFKKCILNKNYAEFDSYLNETLKLSENQSKEKYNVPKVVLKSIARIYKSQNIEANITHRIIIQSLFNTFKDFSLIYKFLILSVELLGFDLNQDFECHKVSKYTDPNSNLLKSLNILSNMLEVVKDNKADLSCCVKINFSQFIENIVNSILNLTTYPNSDSYKILTLCIEIHPLLVERNINNLLTYSMLANNTACSEEYANFLLKIFETYAKLHRIQNLISKMLQALKSSIGQNPSYEKYYSFRGNNDFNNTIEQYHIDTEKALPVNVLDYFTECVVQMASWQVMNLFKTFLFHLDATVTSFADSDEDGKNSFLVLLCKLSSWLLRSIRMAENTVTSTVMENFYSAMNEFKKVLSQFGDGLLKQEHDEILVGSFLDLSHDWSEMFMVFHYYSRNNTEDKEIFCNINHPNYIHSFLSTKQWFSLSQRIANFGESNCKHLMLKLLVQKLRAMQLFGNEMNENVQKEVFEHISADLGNDCDYIISEKFINECLLDKLSSDVIMNMAEKILQTSADETAISVKVTNSRILSNAVSYAVLSKIAQIFKMKTKFLFVKVFSEFDAGLFLDNTQDAESVILVLKNIYEQNLWENEDTLKSEHWNKIKVYLNCMGQLPIPYLSVNIQSTILLCMFSLHKNFWGAEGSEIKILIVKVIIGLLQTMKLDLLDLLEPVSFIKNVTLNFERRESIISLLSENIKNETFVKRFFPIVHYLLENYGTSDNLQHTIMILNDLHKMKKSKNSKEYKDVCSEMKELILKKHFEIVTTTKVDVTLIQSYVCCLKHWLSHENHENFKKLSNLMDGYLNAALTLQSDTLSKGSISLFSTVLHNKQVLSIASDLPLKIWQCCKTREVIPSEVQDFSQMLCLVFEHLPNEEFENVAEDLLGITMEPIEKKNMPQLLKYLNTWSYILTSYFNPVKFKVWQQVLEKLLIKLSMLKQRIDFNQQVFDEIMLFEVAIIQHSQLLISPTMVGVFLMSPVILLYKNNDEFYYYKFHKCADYLGNLLKHRNALIMDRLPTFLKIFRLLMATLCERCNKNDNDSPPGELDKLADCAHQLEKIVRQLVVFKKHIARIAPHLIADILKQYERATLYPKVKIHLNNCIYSLISLCDHHAVSYLLRVLSSASTELFKIMFDNYKRFYRFTGKV